MTLTEKEGPVLLISVDPAHGLSDVLQSRLTDTETQVKGTKGLYARELDVPGWFNALRKRWREKAERVFESFGEGRRAWTARCCATCWTWRRRPSRTWPR